MPEAQVLTRKHSLAECPEADDAHGAKRHASQKVVWFSTSFLLLRNCVVVAQSAAVRPPVLPHEDWQAPAPQILHLYSVALSKS